MSNADSFTDECIIQNLEEGGGSWRDYFLLGSPPSVCQFVAGSGLYVLVIEDGDLAKATIQFLRRRGARSFPSFDEVKQAFDWDGQFRFPND